MAHVILDWIGMGWINQKTGHRNKSFLSQNQRCGSGSVSGSGIRDPCIFDPESLDPGSVNFHGSYGFLDPKIRIHVPGSTTILYEYKMKLSLCCNIILYWLPSTPPPHWNKYNETAKTLNPSRRKQPRP